MASLIWCVMNMAVLLLCRTRRTNSVRRSRAVIELVAQQDFRIDRKRTRDRHSLTHAARQRVRIVILVAGKAEPLEPRPRGVLSMLWIGVEDLQAQPDVVECSAPRHQAVVLEHDADLAAEEVEFPERIAPDYFHLAGTCLDQSGHNVEHRGLATPGFAEDSDDLTFGDFERQSVDSYKIAAPVRTLERLADVLEANDRIDFRHELHG